MVGNDFFPLQLDRVDHLGFARNGPAFGAPAIAPAANSFKLPVVPVIAPDMDPAVAAQALRDYLVKLAESMQVIQRALDG